MADNRIDTRKETDAFINKSPVNSTYRIDLETESPSNVVTTAVGDSILPMTITIGDRDGKPLRFTMLINPENVNHGRTHAIYPAYSRKGYITQMWGPNQDILTGTGKSAAFMDDIGGLTVKKRKGTFGFLNFMSLVNTYKNNGYQFLDVTKVKELSDQLTRVIYVIQGVEISYDDQIFMGHFNNFTLDENAEQPFIFNYNFEFVISSLSRDYNEVRGHFLPIDSPQTVKTEAQTVEDAKTDPQLEPKQEPALTQRDIDALPFTPAFNRVYAEKGKGGVFTWRGKSYALLRREDVVT